MKTHKHTICNESPDCKICQEIAWEDKYLPGAWIVVILLVAILSCVWAFK